MQALNEAVIIMKYYEASSLTCFLAAFADVILNDVENIQKLQKWYASKLKLLLVYTSHRNKHQLLGRILQQFE